MDTVKEELRDGVYQIIFNRPEKKNSISYEVLEGLYGGLRQAEENKSPVVVIRGSGGVFSAGGDLSELKSIDGDAERLSAGFALLNKCILLIRNLNAIVIAVLEGPVVGVATGLSLVCDLSVATQNAFINLGFRRVGLSADGGVSKLLPGIIGAKRSNELFFFSENLNMDEARRLGLVNFVWPPEDFEQKLNETISELKRLPLESIGHFKALTNKAVFSGLEAQLELEFEANRTLLSKPSVQSRLAAMFTRK